MLDEIVCAENCESETLPVVAFSDCDPEINKSEIVQIFIALTTADDFTDVSDPDEWADRLSQTATIPTGSAFLVKDLIRTLTVIGDKPAGTPVTKVISNNRTITVDVDRVINVTIDDDTDANYDLMRKTECANGLVVKAWYLTAGGLLYGGNSGIKTPIGGKKPTLKLQQVLDRGTDGIGTIAGTLAWSNLKSEARVASPFAA